MENVISQRWCASRDSVCVGLLRKSGARDEIRMSWGWGRLGRVDVSPLLSCCSSSLLFFVSGLFVTIEVLTRRILVKGAANCLK